MTDFGSLAPTPDWRDAETADTLANMRYTRPPTTWGSLVSAAKAILPQSITSDQYKQLAADPNLDQEVVQSAKRAVVDPVVSMAKSGATLPGDVYTGKVDPSSDEAITRSMDLGMTAPMFGALAETGMRAAGVAAPEDMQGGRALAHANPEEAAPLGLAAGVSKPFYSRLQEAVDQAPLKSAPADQWLGTLRNTPGVKQAEIDQTGLGEKLAQPGPITKDDLQAHLADNAVNVQTVVKGDRSDRLAELQRQQETAQADYFRPGSDGGPVEGAGARLDEINAAIQDEVRQQNRNGTKFSQYQLPGGENYRETLLTLPHQRGATYDAAYRDAVVGGVPVDEARQIAKAAADKEPTPFLSGHFEEPNILAHYRSNDRVDANGKKTLFLEEVQSDWHQKGRKEGYKGDIKPLTPEEDAELSRLHDMGGNIHKDEALEDRYQELRARGLKLANNNAVPDAPFKKDWHELALKHAIKHAVDNSGSPAWREITKPQGVGKEFDQVLGGENVAGAPLKAMDRVVLSGSKNDKIRGAVVKALPVDVMNVFARNGISPDEFLRNPNMVWDRLPIDARPTVSAGLHSALQGVGTGLRAALNRVLSSESAGRDGELIPTVRASDLNANEVYGLLSPVRATYGHDFVGASGQGAASAGTEASVAAGKNAGIGGEPGSAQLAGFLNRHHALISGGTDNAIKKYEPGYESVSWTPGSVQAERYDLSKQVDKVYAQRNADGTYKLGALVADGGGGHEFGKSIPEARLAEHVGKELADKIVKQDAGEIGYSGDELKVGGEGMKGFYDKILPAAANKIGKKYGANVGVTEIPGESGRSIVRTSEGWQVKINGEFRGLWDTKDKAEAFAKDASGKRQVHVLPITPLMRADVGNKGFSLFANSKKAAPLAVAGAVTKDKSMRLYHGTTTAPAAFDPLHFNPNTGIGELGPHLGTARQASRRVQTYTGKYADTPLEGASVIPVDASIKKPLTVPDATNFDPLSYEFQWTLKHSKALSEDELNHLDELKSLASDELTGSRAYRDLADEAREYLREALKAKGYDSIRYPNQYEGRGYSYIPLNDGSVKNAITGETMFSGSPAAAPFSLAAGIKKQNQ